jgi:hypothetical protein
MNSVKQQPKLQPDFNQRKSASQQQQQQQQQQQHQQQRDFLPFKPPLMMEKAEEIIDRALTEEENGDSGLLRIHRGSLYRPSGSIMYLQRNANLIGKGPDGLCEDGYNWTEIIHQVKSLSSGKNHSSGKKSFIR